MAAIEEPLSPGAQATHEISLVSIVTYLTSLFVSPVGPIVAQYQEIFEYFEADVIVTDFGTLPAYVWRELGGLVNATLSVNLLFTPDPEIPLWGSSAFPATIMLGQWVNWLLHLLSDYLVHSKVNSALNAERAKLGLMKPLVGDDAYPRNSQSRYLHMVPTTAMFEFPRKGLRSEVKFVGPLMPVVGKWERPGWWEEVVAAKADGEGKRVVHIMLGTL